MFNLTSIQGLQKISEEKLYPKLIQQLNKDFELSGLDEMFSEEIKSTELLSFLSVTLTRIVTHQFSEYLNLLYRIDVSEVEIKKIDTLNLDLMCEKVAVLILKRECQKVWLKNKF